MDEDEIARGLGELRVLLAENGFAWIEREPAREAGDAAPQARSPRAQLLDLLRELRTVVVDAPAMTERLLAATGAERVVFKPDPAERQAAEPAADDVTIVERSDMEQRLGMARTAEELIARMSGLARG